MGCVHSNNINLGEENTSNNMFKIYNVNGDGSTFTSGIIEVTEEHLIVHRKKNSSISWPINCLRRYGFERDSFSFEAGRRCPTGEGIFTFRCKEAEYIFRLLHNSIQRTAIVPGGLQNDAIGSTHALPRAVGLRHLHIVENASSIDGSSPRTPISPSFSITLPPSPHTPLQLPLSEPPPPPSPLSPTPETPLDTIYNLNDIELIDKEIDSINEHVELEPISRKEGRNIKRLYINVNPGSDESNIKREKHAYVNLDHDGNPCPSPLQLPVEVNELPQLSPRGLQYVTLQLEEKQPISPLIKLPTQENGLPPGYTTIDFQKTWALQQTTIPNIENDIGCRRRTRHNSSVVNAIIGSGVS